ncbi:hypothetical protein JCM8208_004708 [Rhodotorula glutinis]
MDQLVHRILDPDSRVELARDLLRQYNNLEPAQPRPVAALVFLVDLIASLANCPPPADSTSYSPPGAAKSGELDAASTVTANGVRDSLEGAPRRAAHDEEGAPSGSSVSRRRRGSSVQGDGQAWWDVWREYLGEVYARPPTTSDRADSSTPPEHPSPLLLPPATLVHLRSALARPSFDPDTRSCLLSGCAGSLLHFLSPSSDTAADIDVCPALDMLVTHARPPTFPAPLPSSTVSVLALSLATTRTASPSRRADASRRTLATLLGHYVSHKAFGDILEEGGPSSSEGDRALVLGAFPLAPSSSSAAGVDEPHNDHDEGDDEDDADTRSIAAGIRDAHASIVRKDDKLRWLLGDNFQPGANKASTAARGATHGLHHHLHLGGGGGGAAGGGKVKAAQTARARELSGASTASSTTSAPPDDAIAASKRHQRLTSTTSSTAPLLLHHDPADPPSPNSSPSRPSFASTTTTGRTSFLHRRVLSAGNERIHAPLPPPALLSTSLEHAPAPSPPPTTLAASPARPFADLAPAVPHVRGASPGGALGPPSPTSPRRVSLDSALDAQRGTGPVLHCDSLSAEQRRALVRRSKKLEGFFGAPFGESAAARVLVDRRAGTAGGPGGGAGGGAGSGNGVGRDEVSPTNASFPVEAQPGAPSTAAAAPSTASSTSTSSRRASLAPPGPTPGYAFGAPASRSARLDARRPSALSLSASSQGSVTNLARHPSSTSTTSPSLSPRSPGGTARPQLYRSSSSPSRGRRSSSFSSLAEPRHTYFSERVLADRARDEREERRRKLDKVRRVLGERVPLALVVPGEEEASAASVTGAPAMGRDRSRGGALRDRLMRRPHGGAAGSGSTAAAGRAPEPLAGGGDAGWRYVEPQWDEGTQAGGEEGGETLKKGRPGVNALHRARKLENLFGDLPPPALFLSQASPGPSSPAGFASRPSFLATRQRRSYSDLSDLVSSPFAPGATAGSWLPPSTLEREPTRSSTVASYRASIASLQYVMERDPGALDEVARVYSEAGSSGSRSAAGEDEPDLEEGEEEGDEDSGTEGVAPGMRRSASTSSHRAVRRAQKLSNFFGTTRGEVWRLLLNDIEASVLDDVSLEDDERAEVLAGLERLRQSGPARF